MKDHRGQCFSCSMWRPIGRSLNQFTGLQMAFVFLKKMKHAELYQCALQNSKNVRLVTQFCSDSLEYNVCIGLCTESCWERSLLLKGIIRNIWRPPVQYEWKHRGERHLDKFHRRQKRKRFPKKRALTLNFGGRTVILRKRAVCGKEAENRRGRTAPPSCD